MFPKFYIQNFVRIKHMNFLMLKRETFQTSIKSKTMEINSIPFYTVLHRALHRYTHSTKLPQTHHHWCLERKGFLFHTFSSGFSLFLFYKPSLQRIAPSLNKEGPWLVQHSWTVRLWQIEKLQICNEPTIGLCDLQHLP